MGIREKVSKFSGTVTVIAIAVLVLAITAATRSMGSKSNPGAPDKTQFFFFDPETGELALQSTPVSPTFKNGREIYRAYVYSCSSCSDATSRFVGYIEKLSPERQAKETQMRSGILPGEELRPAARAELNAMGGLFISAPSPVEWISASDPAVDKILTLARDKCPGLPLPCVPGISAPAAQ
jgi:hypothetical protein